MLTERQNQRIQREIPLLEQAYPGIQVSLEGREVIITNDDIQVQIILTPHWPLSSPIVEFGYKGYNYKRNFLDWNGVIDLRTIYSTIINDIEHSLCTQIPILRDQYKLNIEHTSDFGYIEIKWDNFQIIVTFTPKINIQVNENNKRWPKSMIPSNIEKLNLIDLYLGVIETKQRAMLRNSKDFIELISAKLNNATYNSTHQTFTVNHSKGLIVVGLDTELQYLEPDIAIFNNGKFVEFELVDNWIDIMAN